LKSSDKAILAAYTGYLLIMRVKKLPQGRIIFAVTELLQTSLTAVMIA
jgi:hypothetical protein